jgi:hypothetical protein
MSRRRVALVSQAWIEPRADDPEAVSALAIARLRLPAAAGLVALRRARVFELSGPLPERETLADLLHRSTRFYNPHKERCTLRLSAEERAPVGDDERVVLVSERGGGRRAEAERWWLHETGKSIEVREARAWVLAFDSEAAAAERAAEIAVVRGRRQGLLCNPHAEEARLSGPDVPLPWLSEPEVVPIPGGAS